MFALDRLRRENLAIQTAIKQRLTELNASQPYSTTAVASQTYVFPSFAVSSDHLSQSSKSDVYTLLKQHAPTTQHHLLRQNHHSQQFVPVPAASSTFALDVSVLSNASETNELCAALGHPIFNAINVTKTSAAFPNTSRPLQLTETVKRALTRGSHFGRDTSRLDLWSSIHPPNSSQPALSATKKFTNPEDHSLREMKKGRVALFAPVRKKLNKVEAEAKPSSDKPCDHTTNGSNDIGKKPSKNVAKWQVMLESLKKYKDKHGHCIVPRGYEDMKLASWVVEQRKQYRRYQENLSCGIDQDRINRLNEVGFTWYAQEAAWDRQMDHLREFHRIHGHCDVPRDDAQFSRLYLWIREQRRHYKLMKKGQSTLLTNSRIDALNSVGFSFDSLGAIFTSRLQDLLEFRRVYGHCHVPPGYSENANCNKSNLYGWTLRMSKEYKLKMSGQKSTLSEAHICLLNELEFPWHSGKQKVSISGCRAGRNESCSRMSSGGDGHAEAASDDGAASVLSSSSGTSVEVQIACVRPIKKRRVL